MSHLVFKVISIIFFFVIIFLGLFSTQEYFFQDLMPISFFCYFFLQLMVVFLPQYKQKNPLATIVKHFYPPFNNVVLYGFVVVAFMLMQQQGKAYQWVFIAWICVQVLILCSRKVMAVAGSIPFKLYKNPLQQANLKPSWVLLQSNRLFALSNLHTFLLYTYILFPSLLLPLVCLFVVVSIPYLLTVFRRGIEVILYTSGRYVRSIESFIAEYDPEVIFYCSGAIGSVYQLNQWISVLERCEKRVLILAREKHFFSEGLNTSIPAIRVSSMTGIDSCLAKSTRVVLYPANGVRNAQMLRWINLTHIFVNHGESDKVVNVSKFLRCYDKLYVAGQMAIDRTKDAGLDIPDSHFVAVGRPQTDIALSVVNEPITKKQVNILYAPTWEGFSDEANYTSVTMEAYSVFSKLIKNDKYQLLFKAHPYTGSIKATTRNALNKLNHLFESSDNVRIFDAGKNIHDLMNESDMIITDVSSVLNDYLYTEKPIIITNPGAMDKEQYHKQFFSSQAAYILKQDMSNLLDVLEKLIQTDSLREQRRKTKEYSLGNWPQGSLKRFNEQLAENCQS